jgi:hypothetical protein
MRLVRLEEPCPTLTHAAGAYACMGKAKGGGL